MNTSASLPPCDPRLGMPTRTDPARKSLASKLAASPNRCPWTAALLAAGMLCLSTLPARAADGDVDPGFNPDANGYVQGMAVQADGKILLGGWFTTVGGVARERIARVNPDGTLDSGFNPGADFSVNDLAEQFDGRILLGGLFTSVGGTERNRMARLNANGSLDPNFNPNANYSLRSMALQGDGEIVVGGGFNSVAGASRNRIARIHADGTLDSGFNPDANEQVYCVAVQVDGKVLLGGKFTSVGGTARNRLARVNADGTLDTGFNPTVVGYVDSIVLQADGKILLGGQFSAVNGVTRSRIARLNADGSLDSGFNPNASDTVLSLSLQADGKILLGGLFTSVGGTARNYIARVNADGTLDPGFNPGADNYVYSLGVQANGQILLGGTFTSVGGVARNRIARLLNGTATQTLSAQDANQVVWQRGGTAPEVEQVTFELSTDLGVTWMPLGSGTRVFGGWRATGLSLPHEGVIRARGRAAAGYNNGSSSLIEQVAPYVLPPAIGVEVDGGTLDGDTLYFDSVALGQPGPMCFFTLTNLGGPDLILESITATGSAAGDFEVDLYDIATTLAPGESTTFSVTFRPTADGLRGAVLEIRSNDPTRSPLNLALSGTRTRVDGGFNPSLITEVAALAVQTDGRILIGGPGSQVGGANRLLARLDANGAVDPGFNPDPGGSVVQGVVVQTDGKILLGGEFTSVCGVARWNIARVNANGTLDLDFNPGTDQFVRSMAVQPDGKILLGGLFTSVAGTARNYLARLNADGTLDAGFNPNPNGSVECVAVQADGKILLGGYFDSVGGTARNRMARLNADGSLDTGFNPDVSSSPVNCVMVQADGKILLGGHFYAVGGVARAGMARLNPDGTLDAGFNPTLAADHPYVHVNSFALQADGKILVGGLFTTAGGAERPCLVRLAADGTPDLGFKPDANPNVFGVLVQADGKILLGGGFTMVNGEARNCIARLLNEPAIQTLGVPDAMHVKWLRGGTAPEIEQVTFDLSVDGGVTWAPLGIGTRIGGGWAGTGLSLPASGLIRAQGRATGGMNNGSSGLVEQVSSYLLRQDIGVLADGIRLEDGIGSVSFGAVGLGQTGPTKAFTVTNDGIEDLTLGTVTLTGSAAGDYLLDTGGMATSLVPGAATTFTVAFRPTADGLRNVALHIPSNDPDESPFEIALSGTRTRVDSGFDADANNPGTITAVHGIAVQADGKILLGGSFNTVGGQASDQIARLETSGTPDGGFHASADYSPMGVVVQPDGKLVLGGNFTTLGGTTRNRIGRLQSDGTLDAAFNPNAGGYVNGMAPQSDGKLVLGGSFTTMGGTARNRIARLNADGTLDPGFDPNANGELYSVAVQGDGKILLGGKFTTVGGVARNRIARVNADGTLDESFNPDANGSVRAIVVLPNGEILLGGTFTSVSGTAAGRVALLNGDGMPDPSFNPQADATVRSIAVQANGQILLGGEFGAVGGVTRTYLARINADGSLDASFNPSVFGWVFGVGLQADGRILLGGNFGLVDGMERKAIARLLNEPAIQTLEVPDATQVRWLRGGTAPEIEQVAFDLSVDGGVTWAPLGTGARIAGGWAGVGLSLPGTGLIRSRGHATAGSGNSSSSLIEQVATYALPQDIGVRADGTNLADGTGTVSFGTALFGMGGTVVTFTITNAGGGNLTLGTVTLTGNAAGDYQLDTSGMATSLASGASTTFTVAISPTADGLRGAALQIASNDADESPFDIALSGTRTRVDDRFNPNVAGSVFCATVQVDGRILLGGGFSAVGGSMRSRIARLSPDGMLDFGFNPTLNVVGTVFNLAEQADGRILLGGGFTTVGGVPRNRIARLSQNGTLDPSFNPNANSTVFCTAIQTDGKILLGGGFTSIGGTARAYLARLNPDGTLDPDFHPNPSATVYSVVVQADGGILLGGGFTTIGGMARNHLARLHPDGTLDAGFDPNASATVNCVAVQADGKILLGGAFTAVGGVTRNYLARLNPDGTHDPGFAPNVNASVWCAVTQADGKILLAGNFTSVNGSPRTYCARLHGDGTLDESFRQDANNIVYSVALQADGRILLGGNFTTVGGVTRSRFARLLNEPATEALRVSFPPTAVQWLRGGSVPEIEQVAFELSTDFGSTWTVLGGGTRITGGWAATGLVMPPSGMIRARGRAAAGQYNGSSSIIEYLSWYAPPAPEIAVRVNGEHLADGFGTVSFGTVLLGQASPSLTFTVSNTGDADLTVGNITIVGSEAGDFGLDTSAMSGLLAPGTSTTFTVTFRSTADGLRNAALQIANNDADEAPFDVALSGTQTRVDGVGFSPEVGGSAIDCAAVQADGKILIGGVFTTVGEVPLSFIARLNPDGTPDTGFNPSVCDVYSRVRCILVQNDGKIVLGGSFITVGGEPRRCIARLNPDGSLDARFDPSPNGDVCAMALQTDGKILLTGYFYSVGGMSRRYIARLNADGTVDADFNPTTPNLSVFCVALQADGKILLGGPFYTIGETICGPVARLHADGTLDPSFAPNVMGGGSVATIAVLADGRILLGGTFNTVGGTALNNIALVDEAGTVIPGFNPGPNGQINTVAVQADGAILVGGTFTSIGGADRSGVALLNADGTLDLAFNPVIEREFYYIAVSGLAIQRDGKVLMTGNFSTVDGMACNCITRLLNEPATQSINIPDPTHVQWLRGGSAPEIEQATFEFSADSGVTWVPLGSGATRISGGWAEGELSLPASGLIRARGRTTGGSYNGSSGVIEQIAGFDLSELRVTRFVRNGDGSFTIEWLGGGTLQVSETLADWQDVVGATSPYTFPPTASKLFARIRR
ncbi:MAG: choice-of-anchor D domain-containing protein [Verrucomicrobia bacterium]|nr:choice-of-anchor D domain-containing protein [Verrucomicrobiota bacterium]